MYVLKDLRGITVYTFNGSKMTYMKFFTTFLS